MSLVSGGVMGGWIKIADVTGANCPKGWASINIPDTSKTGCRSSSDEGGCYSVFFPTRPGFSQITGLVAGYQKGIPDGFAEHANRPYPGRSIDAPYLDGVSITYGDKQQRKHIWSYGMGQSSNAKSVSNYNCPCGAYEGPAPPSFVRDHYYCDSGSYGSPTHPTFYVEHTLWSNTNCTNGNNCCAQLDAPWFYRSIQGCGARNPIEVRICNDEPFSDEAVIVTKLLLYIQ